MGSAMPACKRRDPSGVMAWQAREWFESQRQNMSDPGSFSAQLFMKATGVNLWRLSKEQPSCIGIGPVDKMVMFFNPDLHPLRDGEFVVVPQNPKGALEMAHMMLLHGMPEDREREAMVLNAPEAEPLGELLMEMRSLMEDRRLDLALQLRADIDAMIDDGVQERLDRLNAALDREKRQTHVVVGAIRPRVRVTTVAAA